jgi:cell division inhibitor SulA
LGESTGFAALDALLPHGGWPQGALSELLIPVEGVGELTLLMPTIARMTQAGRLVALIAPPFCPYAPAWQRAGVDLRYLEIVDTNAQAGSKGALWAFEQCLRSAAFSAVLGWPSNADGPALRRLQVAADTGECLGFAVRDSRHADNPSPAALRIERVQADWRIRKCRGGQVPSQGFAPPSHHALPG